MTTKVYILGGYQTDFADNWARNGMEIADGMRSTIRAGLAETNLEPQQIAPARQPQIPAVDVDGHRSRNAKGATPSDGKRGTAESGVAQHRSRIDVEAKPLLGTVKSKAPRQVRTQPDGAGRLPAKAQNPDDRGALGHDRHGRGFAGGDDTSIGVRHRQRAWQRERNRNGQVAGIERAFADPRQLAVEPEAGGETVSERSRDRNRRLVVSSGDSRQQPAGTGRYDERSRAG